MAAKGEATAAAPGIFAPLHSPVFRRVWSASLLSNFGQLILGVGVAWEMTRLTPDASMVAAVQTALMVPLMLVSLPAGAMADMFDRRRIALTGLVVSVLFGAGLTAIAWFELTTPALLLLFCALIGAGVATFAPAWQASIPEQVPLAQLPAAVALGSISYNVARSVGPAIGGVIILLGGARSAFATTTFCYLPLLLAFVLWRRPKLPSRLPPERIDRAILGGARYAIHSEVIRIVLLRAFLVGFAGATSTALTPLIAKEVLGGNAGTYGLMLASAGVGAVGGALGVARLRATMRAEPAARLLALVGGLALTILGLSRSLPLTCLALFAAGAANILIVAQFNISVQFAAPRWITARALALFNSAITGGVAVGALTWGAVAEHWSLTAAVVASGFTMAATALVGRVLPLPEPAAETAELVVLANQPETALALTLRSGPVIVEIDYDVPPDRARDFYYAMRGVQRMRQRNGGFDWSLSRDIADPSSWMERYRTPTWGDYLRTRDRLSRADLDVQRQAVVFTATGKTGSVRRRLERPFGSVRWKSSSPDPQQETLAVFGA